MSEKTYWSSYEEWKRRLPSFSDPTAERRLFGKPGQVIIQSATASFICGSMIGGLQSSNTAGLRFRAEHAHKLPTSTKGWYFYHKAKNYYVLKHGIQDGFKLGAKLAYWTTAYFVLESSVDFIRGDRKDFVSSMTAGVGLSGIFSLMNRFTKYEAARMARMGLLAGLTYGLLQDAVAVGVKGRRFNYVEALLGRRQVDDMPVAV